MYDKLKIGWYWLDFETLYFWLKSWILVVFVNYCVNTIRTRSLVVLSQQRPTWGVLNLFVLDWILGLFTLFKLSFCSWTWVRFVLWWFTCAALELGTKFRYAKLGFVRSHPSIQMLSLNKNLCSSCFVSTVTQGEVSYLCHFSTPRITRGTSWCKSRQENVPGITSLKL